MRKKGEEAIILGLLGCEQGISQCVVGGIVVCDEALWCKGQVCLGV